jgi:hypothetical protein
MAKYKIPKSFDCMGATWDVVIEKNLMHKQGVFGLTDLASHKIHLQAVDATVSREAQYLCYLHEANHVFFMTLNESELNNNEKLVDMLANLRLQQEKTSRYN